MNEITTLPSIEKLKQQAKVLRKELEAGGASINHSRSLELIAHQHGFRDWNTMYAAVGNRGPASPVLLGEKVSGFYLGQAFEAEVTGVQALSSGDHYRITLNFDEAVDVVRFEGMTNLRKKVSAVIGRDGKTVEKTSDGKPQLTLTLH